MISLGNGLPRWLSGKESACQARRCRFSPWVRKILCRRKWQPTPVFLPGKSHGQRSLVGYSPWSQKSLTRLSDLTTTAALVMKVSKTRMRQFYLRLCHIEWNCVKLPEENPHEKSTETVPWAHRDSHQLLCEEEPEMRFTVHPFGLLQGALEIKPTDFPYWNVCPISFKQIFLSFCSPNFKKNQHHCKTLYLLIPLPIHPPSV